MIYTKAVIPQRPRLSYRVSMAAFTAFWGIRFIASQITLTRRANSSWGLGVTGPSHIDPLWQNCPSPNMLLRGVKTFAALTDDASLSLQVVKPSLALHLTELTSEEL
jgi:hypothetical protein